MRQRPANILPPQLAVEADRGVYLLHDQRRTSRKAPTPCGVGGGVAALRIVGQRRRSIMALITRRAALAAGATLAAATWPRKPRARDLQDLSAALQPSDPPVAAPDIVFVDAGGGQHHLSEFRGHGMVINLWATWCGPCVEEMPSLAALSKTLAPADIAVLPLSSDRGGADAVQVFYRKHAIAGLPVLLDPQGAAARGFGVEGIPTSLVIDKAGRVRARLEGSADWSTPDAAAAVRKLVG
jgi:thiol-disulfide isomerase/thioredoxin